MGIEVEKMEVRKVGFNPHFLKKMFHWVNYNALVEASKIMGYAELPDVADPSMLESEEFLRKFHHALLELHLEEGSLVCPETGRKYPVNKGIPELASLLWWGLIMYPFSMGKGFFRGFLQFVEFCYDLSDLL